MQSAGSGSLGKVLVELGFISNDQLSGALHSQSGSGLKLGQQLVRDGTLSEDSLVSAMSRVLGLRSVNPALTPIHAKVLGLIPPEVALRDRVIPCFRQADGQDETLFVATADPYDEVARKTLEAILPNGMRVKWMVSAASEIAAGLSQHYGIGTDTLLAAGFDVPNDEGEHTPTSEMDFSAMELTTVGVPPIGAYEAFGPYRLRHCIGSGGMAEVFLATTTGIAGFERPLAVKRIRAELANDDNVRRMFIGEANLSVGLRHPNIVQVHNLGEVNQLYFIAMEYVDGPDLRRVLDVSRRRRRPVPMDVALFLIGEIARGLDYCHTARAQDGSPLGIVHRDVSPSNVLLSQQGEVKLTDFGVAGTTAMHDGTIRALRGKPGYMSPEQLADGRLDQRSDIFSAAIIFFEILAGRRLFGEQAVFPSPSGVDAGDVKRVLQQERPDVPPEVARVVTQALETKVDFRLASLSSVHRTIDEVRAKAGMAGGNQVLKTWLEALNVNRDDSQEARIHASGEMPIQAYPVPESKSANPRPVPRVLGRKVLRSTLTWMSIAAVLAFLVGLWVSRFLAQTPDQLGFVSEDAVPMFFSLGDSKRKIVLRRGQEVQVLRDLGGFTLILVLPDGPAGFIDPGAFVLKENQSASPSRKP
jgi:serine/threonine protein kinase